ncbi:hypothetical protein [Amycolatopsis sp. lyj-84]|uniref:hypothetical protein n=1 Tax=Amycolatopsis sp. lyj-84 TaxID=2789284 RepID=UPI00397D07CF
MLATWWRKPLWTPDDVDACWATSPFGTLLVCGHGVDALDLPVEVFDHLDATMPETLRTYPSIALPRERRIVLTSGTSAVLHDVMLPPECRWLAGARWVPLPPTLVSRSVSATWANPPDGQLRLPEPDVLVEAIVADYKQGHFMPKGDPGTAKARV